jgi:folate-dependent phosphoribosylglycinamide formyltransferase PurN
LIKIAEECTKESIDRRVKLVEYLLYPQVMREPQDG